MLSDNRYHQSVFMKDGWKSKITPPFYYSSCFFHPTLPQNTISLQSLLASFADFPHWDSNLSLLCYFPSRTLSVFHKSASSGLHHPTGFPIPMMLCPCLTLSLLVGSSSPALMSLVFDWSLNQVVPWMLFPSALPTRLMTYSALSGFSVNVFWVSAQCP